MKITKEITLDVSRLNRFQSVIAKQNDKNSRYLKVSVADEGNVLIIPPSAEVMITATRPDKLSSSFLGEVSDDGKAIVPLNPWILELDGTLSCEISIITEESLLKTTSFNVDVEPEESSGNSEITQEPNYDILMELIQKVSGVAAVEREAVSKATDEYLREKNIRPLQRGTDYWTPEDKMEIINDVKDGIPLVKTAEQPTFVASIDEMTDTSKMYVMPDGFLYAYMQKTTVTVGKNHFVPTEAILNARLSGSSGSITENGSAGSVVTGFIAVSDWNAINPFEVSISSVSNNGSDDNRVVFYDANKTKLGYANIACSHDGATTPNGVWEDGIETYNLKVDKAGNAVTITDVAYIRMQILVGTKETAITDSDVANLQIKIAHETGTTTQTGFFSTGQAYNQPADYEEDVVQLKRDVNSINEAIIELQNSGGNDNDSDEVSVPTYWQSAVNSCIAKIKALQVGRHCITFPFFSDNHTNTKDLGVLIAKVMKECNIPYCLFGGDAIDSGYLTESQMIGQDKTFDNAMSQIPNGRFCRAIGNHDGFWNDNGTKGYYTRAKVYELFLREEGLAQNKHFGEDGTYYYIDDIASKVRFIVLNTNSEVISAGGESIDSTQLSWLQNTALSFNEDGWGIVIISHCPISNHYHANVTNAEEVISVVNGADVDIIGWFSGHIHRDRMYTHLAVGSADGVEGTNGATLGFTQVVITSDHTGIAYDDTTKHPVANDDLSHAIDFVTINRNTRTVNLTRLGIGSDRSYTY